MSWLLDEFLVRGDGRAATGAIGGIGPIGGMGGLGAACCIRFSSGMLFCTASGEALLVETSADAPRCILEGSPVLSWASLREALRPRAEGLWGLVGVFEEGLRAREAAAGGGEAGGEVGELLSFSEKSFSRLLIKEDLARGVVESLLSEDIVLRLLAGASRESVLEHLCRAGGAMLTAQWWGLLAPTFCVDTIDPLQS